MENVTDALKMAAAALIFIVAFSITMILFSQARQTTDKVINSFSLSDYLPKVEPLGYNVTRKVGIETVIPTIYRYGQSDENIQVRIVDGSKDSSNPNYELQVFDMSIENLAPFQLENSNDENKAYYDKLNAKYNNPNRAAYMYGAPWSNQGSTYILDRINAYIYGKPMKYFDEVNYGSNNLMQYSNPSEYEFEETYLKYRTGGKVSIDEYGEEIVTTPATTKVIITYKVKHKN